MTQFYKQLDRSCKYQWYTIIYKFVLNQQTNATWLPVHLYLHYKLDYRNLLIGKQVHDEDEKQEEKSGPPKELNQVGLEFELHRASVALLNGLRKKEANADYILGM